MCVRFHLHCLHQPFYPKGMDGPENKIKKHSDAGMKQRAVFNSGMMWENLTGNFSQKIGNNTETKKIILTDNCTVSILQDKTHLVVLWLNREKNTKIFCRKKQIFSIKCTGYASDWEYQLFSTDVSIFFRLLGSVQRLQTCPTEACSRKPLGWGEGITEFFF